MNYVQAKTLLLPLFGSNYDMNVAVNEHRSKNLSWNWVEAAADLAKKLESEKENESKINKQNL